MKRYEARGKRKICHKDTKSLSTFLCLRGDEKREEEINKLGVNHESEEGVGRREKNV
jgi:hypothetical protein